MTQRLRSCAHRGSFVFITSPWISRTFSKKNTNLSSPSTHFFFFCDFEITVFVSRHKYYIRFVYVLRRQYPIPLSSLSSAHDISNILFRYGFGEFPHRFPLIFRICQYATRDYIFSTHFRNITNCNDTIVSRRRTCFLLFFLFFFFLCKLSQLYIYQKQIACVKLNRTTVNSSYKIP